MWGDIVLSIVESAITAVGSKWFEKRNREKYKNKFRNIVKEKLSIYADTTLDCDEFFSFVKCRKFKELIKNLFYSTSDELGNVEYINLAEKYICEECKRCSHVEIRGFLNDLQKAYIAFLEKTIEESPEINASFQLLTVSNRDLMTKISKSEESLKRYFKLLNETEKKIDDASIDSYHSVCQNEYGKIRFTGIAGAESRTPQTIDNYYVRNSFSIYPSKEVQGINGYEPDSLETIELEEFFDYGNRVVLIGAAGLGKTTTLNYIFCKYEKLFGLFALKIKIDLKEYAHDISEEKKDLLWCITSEFRKKINRTQYSFEETEKILSKYLDEGRCLIILDAIDEIPTQTIRNKVRDEIGNFCDMFYLNRFIISTREAGYLRNRFNDSFLHVKIRDFNKDQIKKYSKNWHDTYYDEIEFEDFWSRFSIEVERARCEKLIQNPIVLILALIIFDIEKNLPNKRVEFYKKCIETFLTVREDRKAAYRLSEKTKNILGMDLVVPKIAHYKFAKINENMSYKFTFDELKESVFEAIEVDDRVNWSESVKQYTEYLVERTELIHETDEDIYDFAHKTFYEYFLAVYFTREVENEKLIGLLDEWIGDSNYDELARLIIEVIIQKDEPKQHSFVVGYLLDRADDNKKSNLRKYDIFKILLDLYNHNMLQPKFHTKYNSIILRDPRLVDKRRPIFMDEECYLRGGCGYESKILSEMYCKEFLDSDGCNINLDPLFYLNNEFKNEVCDKLHIDYILHISNLFSLVDILDTRNNFRELSTKPTKRKKCEIEMHYFVNDGLEYALRYPQIYISTVVLMVALNDYTYVDKLFDFNFSKNGFFMPYSCPTVLLSLAEKAEDDNNILLLLLILITICSRHESNFLFSFRNRCGYEAKNGNNNSVLLILWGLIIKSADYASFKESMMKIEKFLPQYERIYQMIYEDYHTNEINYDDHFFAEYTHNRELPDIETEL